MHEALLFSARMRLDKSLTNAQVSEPLLPLQLLAYSDDCIQFLQSPDLWHTWNNAQHAGRIEFGSAACDKVSSMTS